MKSIASGRIPNEKMVTTQFSLVVFLVFVIFWTLASVPNLIYQLARFRFALIENLSTEMNFESLSRWYQIGPGKELWLQIVTIIMGTVTIGIYLYFCRLPGRILRALILLALLPAYTGSFIWYKYARGYYEFTDTETSGLWRGLGRLRLTTHNYLNYNSVFSKKQILAARIKTFDQFHDYAEGLFKKFETTTQKAWNLDSRESLKTLFFMNLISRMWSYGNQNHPDQTGCVLNNEKTDFNPLPLSTVNFSTYLNSEIGCCSDSAQMLKFLLDKSHIVNRLIEIPGHVFNEALVDGFWWALDPTLSLVYQAPWQAITAPGLLDTVNIRIFPNMSMENRIPSRYRSAAGAFRHYMLLRVALGEKIEFEYRDSLPDFFKSLTTSAALSPKGASSPM